MQDISNEVGIDVRRNGLVERLRFADEANAENFRELCRLFAEESGMKFGEGRGYWLLNEGKAIPNAHREPAMLLEELVLMEMVVCLMRHRVGPFSVTDAYDQHVCQYGYHNGTLSFEAVRLPERRPISKGQIVDILADKDDVRLPVTGVIVGIDGARVSYVDTAHVKEGYVAKNATILHADQGRVFLCSHMHLQPSFFLGLENVRSYGDFLLRPLEYGQRAELATYLPIFEHMLDDGLKRGDLRKVAVTFRGTTIDRGEQRVMLEHGGRLADVSWQQIAWLTPES